MSLTETLIAKAGSTGFVLLFCAALVFFLRFLYGPKGKFRDPQWDVWNNEAADKERIRRAAVAEEMSSRSLAATESDVRAWLAGHHAAFTAYAREFRAGSPEIDTHLTLKEEHSARVLACAMTIAAEEPAFADPLARRAFILAALYHDVGRFQQFTTYQTYSDAHSCNHALLGAKILRRKDFLKGEAPQIQRMVRAAVALHNRPRLPSVPPGSMGDVVLGVRDADKLDILRIMHEHLGPDGKGDKTVLMHLEDRPGVISPAILLAAEEGRVARYADMRVFNDFRLLLCTWIFDLHFPTSHGIVARSGHLARIAEALDGPLRARELAMSLVRRQ